MTRLHREPQPVSRRFFYDCEFIDDGRTIDLISIGIVAEDGREYYAVSSEFDVQKALANKWLVANVWPHLPLVNHGESIWDSALDYGSDLVRSRSRIAEEVHRFLVPLGVEEPHVELWAWYAAYDHVCLAQLWGPMMSLPAGIPLFTRDLKQECDRLGNPPLPDQVSGEHNALADARHNLMRARALGIVP